MSPALARLKERLTTMPPQHLGAIALSTPALVAGLLLRGIIFVPLMALLIWITRRIQRALKPPPARAPHRRPAPPG